ncbi:putative ABC transport system ATP-binding protein [Clostridium acetobutylicum]|uniref:ABC transporter, ATPase component n=1 Tax=Clostridium acetobutylicum (strain ATCC 824 / DSM 792 / JCM 1419 / IAM 19013 / LMG 5710 / NBRC 13948 / NRRL B-527 / VKM B-1787 / 2291 / W) TaxID=272562 RepID=Q97GV9_CLOAB|nr:MULTISPECIES: ABC transporter ATP-binding protein [Clostridium]AAK80213.1 ABC transporter, ATPase component [Clostridium acetobutylicum ATCC 824]ADZ21308.1 ABC transporter, ATPase component [Clostridium acetobutylicum EA 2018]AEI32249.1 ABC transporter, ATPase component [Clostridium acetobutylicum DSM 1731]AWV79362.1 ABC transporter ATP-binding protein [Clostridium acetobutylicum]MBC2394667.1 ABC transporter ATP-binding protein [Clostridium acetobutylicum]
MKNLIEVKSMYKSFNISNDKVDVLKNINLNIEEGAFVSVMGPSGCGKSTLLYILGGLDSATSGSVFILGREYSKMKEKEKSALRRQRLGFVFQFYNLIPNLNVEDNILLPLLLDGKNPNKYKKKLDELLEIIGMTTKRKFTPRELSGGQQQRVSIARALIFDPDIILADEPIGNLDSKSGMQIMKLFNDINKDLRKTIVQVTHSLESSHYGNKIVNLKDGKII